MNKLSYIQYNSSNNDRAKENRKNPTKVEAKIWYDFLRDRPLWYKFIRQKPIDSFILDFYCSKLLLWIEVDWKYHDYKKSYDYMRTLKIWKSMIKIIRYTNDQIDNHFFKVKKSIIKEINIRKKELELIS